MKSRLEGADDAVKALINEHRPDLILNAMASRCLFDVITHGE
jgi:dTDP-4-dehydrorhamnose reductase